MSYLKPIARSQQLCILHYKRFCVDWCCRYFVGLCVHLLPYSTLMTFIESYVPLVVKTGFVFFLAFNCLLSDTLFTDGNFSSNLQSLVRSPCKVNCITLNPFSPPQSFDLSPHASSPHPPPEFSSVQPPKLQQYLCIKFKLFQLICQSCAWTPSKHPSNKPISSTILFVYHPPPRPLSLLRCGPSVVRPPTRCADICGR